MSDPTDDGFGYDPGPGPRRPSSSGFLLDAARRRPVGRRILSAITVLLFVGGIGLFLYPMFTDVYTNTVVQSRLEDQFRTITVDVGSVSEWQAAVSEQGTALTRIAIPSIDVETLVVEGTSAAALRAGAGHYPNTPLPGQVGNVAIAGHRTTYGRPFNRLDQVKEGDEIWLSTPIGDYKYVVTAPPPDGQCKRRAADYAACVTTPTDWTVIGKSSEPILTLTSCHPKGSAAQRIVLRAHLEGSFDPGTYLQKRDAGEIGA